MADERRKFKSRDKLGRNIFSTVENLANNLKVQLGNFISNKMYL